MQISGGVMDLAHIDSADIYGHWVASRLERIQIPVTHLANKFIADFYKLLAKSPETRKMLERLTPVEFAQLQNRQVRHLMVLISPSLTRAEHMQEAERAGRAHALAGVDVHWLIETYSTYQQKLFELLDDLVPDPEEREPLIRVLSRRMLLDVEGQSRSFERINREVSEAFLRVDGKVLIASNHADLVREAMWAVCGLEGEVCVLLARADAKGVLQIEASCGDLAQKYHRAMEDGIIPKISIDPTLPAGQGLGGRAWRSRQIEISDAWQFDDRAKPWISVGRELGFRSSASVPLLDESGESIALFSMYSAWPGFFSMLRVRSFLSHVQSVVSHAMQRLKLAPVIPMLEQEEYRELLEEGRVIMLYQPIIDLKSGSLVRLEGLARLQASDGSLISPARFLPVFGGLELLQLFEHGLRQICAGAREMEAMGVALNVSINLPAEGLGDQRYEQAILRILAEERFAPQRLQLEILESQDGAAQTEQKQQFVERLREFGVRFAQDDLGSGHSSLLRMGQYTFDEVKIDQGLVRSVLDKPQRALQFILYLTRLAQAPQTQVVIEGLENLGMLEAAAILGADHGQGYGIGRPMPASDVVAWLAGYQYPVDPLKPQTALGAMAAYLLWKMQMEVLSDCAGALAQTNASQQGIGRFLAENALEESPLGKLLREGPSSGDGSEKPTSARQLQILEYLTAYWLKELTR